LVANRLRRQTQTEQLRQLNRYRDLAHLLEQVRRQHAAALNEYRSLLRELRVELRVLLEDGE
jgi:hypothetical protein